MTEKLTSWSKQYLVSIIASIFSAGYHGKTVDMAQYSDRHRNSISRFLREDGWDAQALQAGLKKVEREKQLVLLEMLRQAEAHENFLSKRRHLMARMIEEYYKSL